MRSLSGYVGCILLLATFLACQKSEYHQLVKRELASGERHDTLFLNMTFGMSRDSFFAHCFKLNRQGLVHQGMKNNSVEYPLQDTLPKGVARLNFYPEFHDGKLYRMPVSFRYDAWAPWKTDMQVDSMLPDVLALLEEWHGGEFIPFGTPETGRGWVKVDGNRRILVTKEDIQRVKFTYQDLSVDAPPVPVRPKGFPNAQQ